MVKVIDDTPYRIMTDHDCGQSPHIKKKNRTTSSSFVRNQGGGLGKRERYTLAAALASAAVFILLTVTMGFGNSVRFGMILLFIPVFVYLQYREKPLPCTPETIMNEAPSVIGMMSVTLSSNGSFDSAVRYVADNGPKNISKIFKKVIMDADCRAVPDIKDTLMETISVFPKELSAFRRALHIVATAFESNNEIERQSIMKDAENIVLEGLRTIGNTYSAKLNTPCMFVFGLGIMVPMILISVLPMLSMGGQFAVKGIDSKVCEFLILVVIPAIVGVVVLSLRGKNPFYESKTDQNCYRYIVPLILTAPCYLALCKYGFDSNRSLVISATVCCIISLAIMLPSVLRERKRAKTEEMLKDALFELGNRLSMRENFDTAVIRAFESRKDCVWIYDSIKKELAICRGDVEGALRTVLEPVSKTIADFYCDVYRASLSDITDAGKLAAGMAHQLQDQNNVRKDIENKLKSMLDMMTGTSAIFAPLILGMSVVMLGPISSITGTVFFSDITGVLLIYLIELSALISVLSSNLVCKGGLMDILFRFCASVPISLVLFTACSMINI